MSIWPESTLFPKATAAHIQVPSGHEFVRLTTLIDWRELTRIAVKAREKKCKKLTGREPRYRQLLGAVVLMAIRGCNLRDAEDLISYYAPARFLCDLMDSDNGLDHVTIFEFTQMLGPEGMAAINEHILCHAATKGYCDPTILMSDTTAQEARIPYPNEMGLMSHYMSVVERTVGRLRGVFDGIKGQVTKGASKVRGLLRNSHLFAKGREQKQKIGRKTFHTVKGLHGKIKKAIAEGGNVSSKAGQELRKVAETMDKLLPQIRHFFETGFVAAKKIIHIKMPDVYAIVRGKAGKNVEFGLKWGINRLGGGFVAGFLLKDRKHGSDQSFCKKSLQYHEEIFQNPPKIFGFDRGGDSRANVQFAKKSGVNHVGIAPRGRKKWQVGERMKNRIRCERARVEGSIGTIKSSKYGFTKPKAFSSEAMERCGHRAILGFNLRKMIIIEAAAATS